MVAWFLGFLVSCFLGFLVYWFLSFVVSRLQRVLVSWFQSSLVSSSQSFKDSKFQKLFVVSLRDIDPILPSFHFVLLKTLIQYSRFSGTYQTDREDLSAPVFSKVSKCRISNILRFKTMIFPKKNLGCFLGLFKVSWCARK